MSERTIKKVNYGKTERRSFAQVREVCEMPYLVEVQKASYKEFIESGIGEVLKDYSPIRDYSNNMELSFIGHEIEMTPKYSEKECKDRETTYEVILKMKVRLLNGSYFARFCPKRWQNRSASFVFRQQTARFIQLIPPLT